MRIVLSNISYSRHTTNEGNELQLGLEHAGYRLVGKGYGDDLRNVPEILKRYSPKVIVVSDVRDWHRDSPGNFGDLSLHFDNYECLKERNDILKIVVAKDAGTAVDFQSRFAKSIGAQAAICYYHDNAVLPLSPWLSDMKRIRTYHSVDGDLASSIPIVGGRSRAIVTGAVGVVYPLRKMIFSESHQIGVETLRHPGYKATKCFTPEYLRKLASFKVHVATCSSYNFALRKIIESVAMGCTPVTNLPEWDRLPEIDEYLYRIPSNLSMNQVRQAIDKAESSWNIERASEGAKKAVTYYNWKSSGRRLVDDIESLVK